MLLTNEMMLAVTCTANKNDGRRALEQIKITGKKAIATNGHVLIEIENNTELNTDDFPEFEGIKNTEDDIYLHTSEVEKIKKLKVKSSVPILNAVEIGKNGDVNTAHILIPDLDNLTTIRSKQGERLNFPDTEKFKESNNDSEKIHTTYLTPSELQRLLDVAKKVKSERIRFDFYKDGCQPSPIEFEIDNATEHKITGILMPRRAP